MSQNPAESAKRPGMRGMRVGLGFCGWWVACLVALFIGCSERDSFVQPSMDELQSAPPQTGSEPPSGLVEISFSGDELTIWPYTGSDFSGDPIDPINLVFVGNATPGQIRAALLSLDGDRSAFGLPPVPPFNSVWSDGLGGVQTTFAEEGEGWIGSVIQLQLGSYGPLRYHLRLFRTGEVFGDGGEWTLGGAHFEVLIPGTADHQVLSWERAEEIVMVDFIRSGLLDATIPHTTTGSINDSPSFRTIPAAIYNGLPEPIKAYIGGPPGTVTDPVPILTNGEATILNVAGTEPIAAGNFAQSLSLTYNQFIPRPFCIEGPFDWVRVEGPVSLQKNVLVDSHGRYSYQSRIDGQLVVTPVDITQFPPVPIGPSFNAVISDDQHGAIDDDAGSVSASIRRIAPQDGGAEILITRLKVATHGLDTFSSQTHCLEP